MSVQTYTHRDLAKLLGVSETTIKSYRSKFPSFLPVAREGKPVRLHAEALAVCTRIRDLFAFGLSILQTTQSLRSEFKEYPSSRRLSIASRPGSGEPALTAPAVPAAEAGSGLLEHIQAMARAQEQSRQRMERLEAEVRNLATLEAASKALVADLLAELRTARSVAPAAGAPPPIEAPSPAQAPSPVEAPPAPEAGPSVLTARKIVTVHGQGGAAASYALTREPKPEPLFPEPPTPAPAFLDLPAVIRSDRGDFLGLPGGQSVRRLVEVLSPEGAPPATWFQEEPEAWTCSIPLGRAQNREMLFERTTTPRGNLVGLIRRMRINEAEATPVQLQEIFRQLRDQMA